MARPNVLSILKKDHARVKELLDKFAETTDRGVKTRRELLAEIETEIEVHAKVEEEIFYPAYLEAVESKEDRKLFFEAKDEHAMVRQVLDQLHDTPVDSEEFGARAKILKDLVEHHAKEEEEGEMFPKAREALGEERLVELAEMVEERREVLLNGKMSGKRHR
jgi:hypothetical protein